MPKQKPDASAMRVSAYISTVAYESLARVALAEERSLSATTASILTDFLRRRGLPVVDAEARARKSDFNPAKTLAAALGRKRTALAREDERTAAKIAKLSK